jgi:hypothetical protein
MGKDGWRVIGDELGEPGARSGFHWAKWLIAENKKLEILLWNIIF